MYWVLGSSVVISFINVSKMEVSTAGPGVLSTNNGIVSEINGNQVIINDKQYDINIKDATDEKRSNIPVKSTWQEIVVKQNQS